MARKLLDSIFFIVLIGINLLVILPIILLFLLSFSAAWKWPEVLPHSFTLRAWQSVLSNPTTIKAAGTSFEIALIVVFINILLAIPAGDALGRYEFKCKGAIESILLIPIIVPPIVVMMGIHKTFIIFNLTETTMGVVLAHIIPTLPYTIKAMTISFKSFGFEWQEQAKMLGAGKLHRFFHVTLPFLLPGIIAGSSLTILISLSQYIITLLIGGGQIVTLPILMFPFINGGNQSIGAVYSILFAIIALISLYIMDLFLKRYYD